MRIGIIGGGPAGLMAAIAAAENGKEVILFEKMPACGKKLRLTGNGRCNVTNEYVKEKAEEMYFEGARFLYSAFSGFSVENTKSFFSSLGVPLKTEDNGRIFPQSDRSSDILEALLLRTEQLGVRIFTGKEIKRIVKEESGFTLFFGNEKVMVDRVIFAVGGASFSETGSDGSGYSLLQELGHTISVPRPALVPIHTSMASIFPLQGISIENVAVSLYLENKLAKKETGALLFTHFGVTGPAVFRLSRHLPIEDRYYEKNNAKLKIDFFPAFSEETLENHMMERIKENQNKTFRRAASGLIQNSVFLFLLNEAKIQSEVFCRDFSKKARRDFLFLCKNFSLPIINKPSFSQAMVTRGGVKLSEVNPKTMESKLVPGLFLAGEILDIDGDTGGFNIQAALSTGYAAGKASSHAIFEKE